jgi:hypothetical protein
LTGNPGDIEHSLGVQAGLYHRDLGPAHPDRRLKKEGRIASVAPDDKADLIFGLTAA